MATNRQVTKGPQPPPESAMEEWNEEQLEAALKHLKQLHIKARNLRSTIPEMIQPFGKHPPPPTDVFYGMCQQSLMAGVKSVKSFRDSMTSQETKKVLEHANQSRKKNSKGIIPWRAADEPDWAIPDA